MLSREELILICSHNSSLCQCAKEAGVDVNTFKRWCIKNDVAYPQKYVMSDAAKASRRKGNIGKKHNFKPGTLEKLSKLKKGVKLSEEHRLAISVGHIKYFEKSENRIKQSEVLKNRNYKHSEQTKAKIGESNKGKIYSEESRKKISNSLKEFYKIPENKAHVAYVSHTDEVKAKIRQTCLERYGVEYPCMTEQARNASQTISKVNLKWKEFLNISDNDMEFVINRYSYDLKKGNVLIEINPAYSHNSAVAPWFGNKKGSIKDSLYHLNKTKLAEEAGYRCIHVWDWDDPNKIKMLIDDKIPIYARKCEIREVSKKDNDSFLNTYHIQNTCKGQSVRLGLYYKNELIELMTFGKPRYNKKYEWELLRLCTSSKYIVVGGASKLFHAFIERYAPKSIISYCDRSKFTGKSYLKLGFRLMSAGKPSKHWYNIEQDKHITDNLLRQQGADRLLNTEYGKNTSNEEIMLEHKYIPVYDCGQDTYTWFSKN